MSMTEQEFYDKLALFFDVLTDWPARLAYELPFLLQTLPPGGRLLDAACGTGWHTLALAERGYEAMGADISPAMVQRAQANAALRQNSTRFVVSSFADLPQATGGAFDGLLCLGNSLVHVLDEDGLRASLQGMAACLRPGGVLVVHNLNYDRRWAEKPRWFQANGGELDGKETLVWRFADYGEKLIGFNIAVFQKQVSGQWTRQVQTTLQRPWQSSDLVGALGRAGFAGIRLYGSLAGEPYRPAQSDDCVIVAGRSGA